MAVNPEVLKSDIETYLKDADTKIITLYNPTADSNYRSFHSANTDTDYQCPTDHIFRIININLIASGTGTEEYYLQSNSSSDSSGGQTILFLKLTDNANYHIPCHIDIEAGDYIIGRNEMTCVINGIEMDAS